MKTFVATLAFARRQFACGSEGGQVVQGTGVGSSLRVTVLDQTEAALIIAQVTIVDARGVEQTADGGRSRGRRVREPHAPAPIRSRPRRKASVLSPRRSTCAAARTAPRCGWRWRPSSRACSSRTERRRPPRQRLHADAHAGGDRLAARRSGRDGRGAGAHGRAGRADFRQRLPRRPPAAEGSDPADPLSHQLVLGRVPRSRHDSRRGDHQARHGRLARPHQLRLPRRIAERHQRVRRRKKAPSRCAATW